MSDVLYAVPGDEYTVEVVADSSGTVATRGMGVELTGSRNRNPEVSLVESGGGDGVGVLQDDPEDFSGNQGDYAAGDPVGKATLVLTKPVIVCNPDAAYTPSVGDFVKFVGGGGVTSVTGPTATSVGTLTNSLGVAADGTLETTAGSDTELDLTDGLPFGRVFDVNIPEFNVGDGIAVVTHR